MKISPIALCLIASAAHLWGEAYSGASSMLGIDPNAGRNSFLTLLIPGGGKYEGMATAHTATAFDGGYLESNPAAGSFVSRRALMFSHVDWIADSSLESISYTFRPEALEELGVGFGGKFLHVPFTGYNTWGAQSASGGYTEFIASAAVSYNFLRSFYFGGISVGAALKIGCRGLSASLAPNQNALSLMGDLGVMTKFNFLKFFASREMNFSVGMMLKNMGAEFIESPDPLPSYASLGIAYRPISPLTLAFDVNLPFNLDGTPAEALGFAAGADIKIASFLSFHTGVLIKTGKPRFAVGANVQLKSFTLTANYTLDLTTRLELFDRMSVSVKMNLKTLRRAVVEDNAQALYLDGLKSYSIGDIAEAIRLWEAALKLDPTFKPAAEMLNTAGETLEIEEELQDALIN